MADHTATTYDSPTGLRLVLRYGLLIVVAALVLFPVYTTVVAALKPGNEVLNNPLVPNTVTFDVLGDAWTEGRLGRFLLNSAIVTVIVTAAQLVTSVLSAYAFALLEFPGRTLLFGVFLATAFGTFLMRQVFLTLPRDLRDAAAIDGVGHLGFLWNVAIPLVRPTLGAMTLFSVLSTWNQYLWPNLVTTEADMYTVQSGLKQLAASGLDRPNLVMAGVVIAVVPIVVALLLFQRQLVRGLTAGAVKG